MARYWVYLNDEVAGPFGIDQLIRLRGFSRQTLVCVEEASGQPKNWISPAQIPELEHIFRAAIEQMAEPQAAATPPPTKRTVPKPARASAPAVTLKTPKRNLPQTLGWVLLVLALLGGAAIVGSYLQHRESLSADRLAAQQLIENIHLPAPSPYASLPQYFDDKNIHPRWQFDRKPEGIYSVTLSWYGPALTVYAFEVNLKAQTVRGLNSAASQLLSEGFPAAPKKKGPATPPAKKSPSETFAPTLEAARLANESGDFQAAWNQFSQRKKADMAKAGISQEGFIRLQSLTHRVETGLKLSVLKSKAQSESEMLVLIKQTQPGKPDVFIKQFWVFENDAWKLDDEQKRGASPELPAPAPIPAPAADTENKPAAPNPTPTSLPGMSN